MQTRPGCLAVLIVYNLVQASSLFDQLAVNQTAANAESQFKIEELIGCGEDGSAEITTVTQSSTVMTVFNISTPSESLIEAYAELGILIEIDYPDTWDFSKPLGWQNDYHRPEPSWLDL